MPIATISEIRRETPTVKSFLLDCGGAPVSYLPGQWVELTAAIDGEKATGAYSLTTSPTQEGPLRLAIKESRRHAVSQWLYDRARVGDRVEMSEGQGLFVFQPEMAPRVVLVGAGVGITPLMSIFRFVADAAPEVGATLVYSIPNAAEYLFRSELRVLVEAHANLRMLVTATQELDPEWTGRRGRIDHRLLAEAGDTPETLYFLCGPPGMVEDVSAILAERKVSLNRIVFEKWW